MPAKTRDRWFPLSIREALATVRTTHPEAANRLADHIGRTQDVIDSEGARTDAAEARAERAERVVSRLRALADVGCTERSRQMGRTCEETHAETESYCAPCAAVVLLATYDAEGEPDAR